MTVEETELYISKSKMISSRIFIHIFVIIFISEYCNGAECGPGRLCKYGGTCGTDNQCRCVMNCNTNSWGIDFNDMYCLPRKGRRPTLLFGICYALTEACERQEDIPLIKYDFKTRRCDASNELPERFCPTPHAFMGTCGGTLERNRLSSSTYDGGVCLQTPGTENFRCRCPLEREGATCEQKALPSVNGTKNDTSTKIIGVSIGASVGAAVLVCALIRCWRRKRSKRTNSSGKAEESVTVGCDKIQPSNRTENDVSSLRSFSSVEITSISETKATSYSLAKTEITPPATESPRRQRLTGYSAYSAEDTNNNLGTRNTAGERVSMLNGTATAQNLSKPSTLAIVTIPETARSHNSDVDDVTIV